MIITVQNLIDCHNGLVRTYSIVVEEEEGGGYFATVPALPGCFTQGATVEECEARAVEAIEAHIAGLDRGGREDGVENALMGVDEELVGVDEELVDHEGDCNFCGANFSTVSEYDYHVDRCPDNPHPR